MDTVRMHTAVKLVVVLAKVVLAIEVVVLADVVALLPFFLLLSKLGKPHVITEFIPIHVLVGWLIVVDIFT
ncbi:hypothetical protein HN873_064401, partial [Arachis hypogaea]